MTEGLWAAIIGVGGTIFGTFLGFILGKIDIGRLKISVKKIKEKAYYDKDTKDATYFFDSYSESYIVSIYNGSNKNRVVQDLCVDFICDKQTLTSIKLKDLNTFRMHQWGGEINNVGMVNIPPKMGIDIRTTFTINDIDKLRRTKSIILSYKNEKFRVKRKMLWKCDYANLEIQSSQNKSYEKFLENTDEEQDYD